MNISTSLPYIYSSRRLQGILNQSKHDSVPIISNLLKILDAKDSNIENFDFAANFPSIVKFLIDNKSDKNIYDTTMKMFQAALSNLTMKCRQFQNEADELKNKASIDDVSSCVVDLNNFSIDKENIATNSKKAEICLVHDKKKNYYAVKKFKRNFDSIEYQRQFIRYLADFSKMKHPSILKFAGFNLYYRSEGRTFCPAVLTEYQRKKSLQDVIQNTGSPITFNDTQKMILLLGVATAMRYLHKRGYSHGNLKPSNVLLNSKFEPFVGDFFSNCGSVNNTIELTSDSNVRFVAPELFTKSSSSNPTATRNMTTSTKTINSTTTNTPSTNTINSTNTGKVTQASDVYSYGMVAFSIMTSLLPLGADITSPEKIISMINNGERPQFPSYVPTYIVEFISRCWKKEPEDRPTFNEIVGQLLANNMALPDTDMDAYSAYIKKVCPSHRAPKHKFAVSTRSANPNVFNISSPGPEIKGKTNFDDPASVFQLAMKLKNGEGVPENIPQALKYIKKSADAGYPKAQIEYGKLLLDGIDNDVLQKNEIEASHFFHLAAEQGDAEGQYLYGHACYYGIGTQQNFRKAAKLLQLSATQGNRDALYLFGLCLKEGNGAPQNIPMAIKCFTIAHENGEVSATRHLRELGVDV
ncbi:hypothetical protein TRFO_33339 [Tritrichomonas foetus]|uniref:Protein kinase domain-containing protein n=1 Tax=Tritrichomonas foetus TaxID=1144522 RepID=A0A1J4JNR2_9EUKA|nr:hypothetical protein TRFO_33339 [Tritrichomonas foetus]|eukprot:OHT00048.1 hypothetical protein TRFO_33339 [Tritrichomonas foetus]